jgi:hypothetical protein
MLISTMVSMLSDSGNRIGYEIDFIARAIANYYYTGINLLRSDPRKQVAQYRANANKHKLVPDDESRYLSSKR